MKLNAMIVKSPLLSGSLIPRISPSGMIPRKRPSRKKARPKITRPIPTEMTPAS